MSKFHWQILSKNQIQALKSLKRFSKYGVLAGGTALALQFNHRKSLDLDVFLPKPISRQFVFAMKQHYRKIDIIVNTGDEFSFQSPFRVKTSLVFYPFSPLYKSLSTPYLKISHWRDIALDKAETIGRRGEWRDYIDLYFCVQNGFAIKDIISEAERKFGDLFSEKLFLSQLCYFGDIRDFHIQFTKEKVSQSKLQKFFEKEIKKIKI